MATRRRRKTGRQNNDTKTVIAVILFIIVLVIITAALIKSMREADKRQREEARQRTQQTEQTTKPQPATTQKQETTSKREAAKKRRIRKHINRPSEVGKNQIVEHSSFTLSYNEKHEQADWVFYLLTKAMTRGGAERTDNFKSDPKVTTGSATSSDYSRSGYDRGHLCPSADVRHDETAQAETFYMSNMSPQAPGLNRGEWKSLEEHVRDWVNVHDSLYVAVGPVLSDGLKYIGKRNKVAVPEHYYKIIYSPADGGHIIAFLMPNKSLKKGFGEFVVTVDSIEKLTGIDFFSDIDDETVLESSIDTDWWGLN